MYENAIKKYPVSAETLCLSWFDNSIEKYDFKVFNRIFMYLNKMESQGYIHYGMHLVSICYCKKVRLTKQVCIILWVRN